jgi:hypothetical protein
MLDPREDRRKESIFSITVALDRSGLGLIRSRPEESPI